ncbi:MAG: hypothetical protein ACO377_08005 [Pseudomonadales bacterium]
MKQQLPGGSIDLKSIAPMLRGVVLLLGLFNTPIAPGEEAVVTDATGASRTAPPQPTTAGGAAAQAATPGDATSPLGASDEVFKPTEEISEDFTVPFPVDI